MKKNKIFISHSSKDIQYVQSFVENILKLGLDIPSNRIFCSSIEGQGIQSGKYIPDSIKEEIINSSLALLFISQNYKESEVCLNELGAAWVLLSKEKVVPILLPDVDFSELGFIDRGRLGLQIFTHEGVMKFVQDCKKDLNPDFNLERLSIKTKEYLESVNKIDESSIQTNDEDSVDEWTECYTNNLYALDEIIRSNFPTYNDGIHQINDKNLQVRLLSSLDKAKFLKRFWYKFAKGDSYVEKITKLPSGNWLMSSLNWEIKISEMWVSMNSELQYEFILIKSEALEPFEIQSDVGGTSYRVGVLNDGTIISDNEKNNGFAMINGETIKLTMTNSESRYREQKTNWIFLASNYHKVGYNYREIFDFCKKLDSGEIVVNEENIMDLLRSFGNHPTVIRYM